MAAVRESVFLPIRGHGFLRHRAGNGQLEKVMSQLALGGGGEGPDVDMLKLRLFVWDAGSRAVLL